MNRIVRLGLLGLGNQGQQHLEAARGLSEVRIVAGCDLDRDRHAEASRIAPHLALHIDVHEMLTSEALDGLILALPHGAYESLMPVLAGSGLPLLKEKPLGMTVSEANRFIAQVLDGGGFLKTALQRRRHPSYQHLARILRELAGTGRSRLAIHGLHGALHLGLPDSQEANGWRGSPSQAGGGALLDCGYHLVDLVQLLVGPFALVSAQLWKAGLPASPEEVETEATLHGLAGHTWIRLHVWRQGDVHPDDPGKRIKKEEILVETDGGVYRANREGVWLDGEPILDCSREWAEAMKLQLQAFASDIQRRSCDAPEVWAQVPTMRIIQQAYALARQYHVGLGGMGIPLSTAQGGAVHARK